MDGMDPAGWDAPPRSPLAQGAAPILSVDGFEGPLDWLLELARTRRIDLARLSIAALVTAFATALAAALAEADRRPLVLARWGDWLVMAADLALLRSRLLVPEDPAALSTAQTAAEILRARLLARAAMMTAADWLDRREQAGRDVFTRGLSDGDHAVRAARTPDVTALLRACLAVIRLPPDAASLYRVPAPPGWSVAKAADRMRAMLASLGEGGAPLAAFLPDLPAALPDRQHWCRSAVANTFMAGLEMTREGVTAIEQAAPWAPIQLRQGQGPSNAAG